MLLTINVMQYFRKKHEPPLVLLHYLLRRLAFSPVTAFCVLEIGKRLDFYHPLQAERRNCLLATIPNNTECETQTQTKPAGIGLCFNSEIDPIVKEKRRLHIWLVGFRTLHLCVMRGVTVTKTMVNGELWRKPLEAFYLAQNSKFRDRVVLGNRIQLVRRRYSHVSKNTIIGGGIK